MPHAISVYPRWRGEHPPAEDVRWTPSGLSPLARGTQQLMRPVLRLSRFIPAGAGNTIAGSCPDHLISVYPRWRGEHWSSSFPGGKGRGLSPLARGTHRHYGKNQKGARFIPAGAGNTEHAPRTSSRTPVYPRWRGEHCRYSLFRGLAAGLSPLARGTLSVINCHWPPHRFIPAGAGNTNSVLAVFLANAVYPRWRGEHLRVLNSTAYQCGLSPLARGTLVAALAIHDRGRFIPAGAGNTPPGVKAPSVTAVYPRWRGEHS